MMEAEHLIITAILSLKVAVCATLLALPAGFFVAVLMRYVTFRGKILLEVLINLPLALPPVVIGSLLLYLLHPDHVFGKIVILFSGELLFTWKAAVASAIVVGFPLLVRAIRINLDQIDLSLLQTARSLGAGNMDVVFSIILPLVRPGLIAGALMMFVRSIGEFGATIMISGNIPNQTQTLSLAIYEHASTPGGEQTALFLSTISLGLAVVVLVAYDYIMKKPVKGGG